MSIILLLILITTILYYSFNHFKGVNVREGKLTNKECFDILQNPRKLRVVKDGHNNLRTQLKTGLFEWEDVFFHWFDGEFRVKFETRTYEEEYFENEIFDGILEELSNFAKYVEVKETRKVDIDERLKYHEAKKTIEKYEKTRAKDNE